jgi:hypothetical protein
MATDPIDTFAIRLILLKFMCFLHPGKLRRTR